VILDPRRARDAARSALTPLVAPEQESVVTRVESPLVAGSLAALSGVLALAAEWTAPQPLLAWIAPVPVLVATFLRRERDPWWLGLLWGLLAHVPVLRWAWLNPNWPLGATCGAYAGLVGLRVGQLEVLAATARVAPALAPVAFAAAVTLMEWLLECAHLALWWTWAAPLAPIGWLHGISALGGTYLVSFVAALGAATLASMLVLRGRATLAAGFGAAVVVAAFAVAGVRSLPGLARAVRVAAVVHRLDPITATRWDAGEVRHEDTLATLAAYEQLTRAARTRGASVIVWPEYAVYVAADDLPLWRERVGRLAADTGATVVAAFIDVAQGGNRALLAMPGGEVVIYTKQFLAPGIESSWLRPGTAPFGAVGADPLRVGARICYDAEYAGGFRAAAHAGVHLIAIPSRDWRGIEVAHAAPVPFRASENGLAVVRATRGGRSLVVDPHGTIVAQADDTGTADVLLVADVPVAEKSGATLYGRVGNWPPTLAAVILVLVVLRAEAV
jgi:apolipoprotein N-acyltransferase